MKKNDVKIISPKLIMDEGRPHFDIQETNKAIQQSFTQAIQNLRQSKSDKIKDFFVTNSNPVAENK